MREPGSRLDMWLNVLSICKADDDGIASDLIYAHERAGFQFHINHFWRGDLFNTLFANTKAYLSDASSRDGTVICAVRPTSCELLTELEACWL